jgi:hypothetical protein
VGQIPLPIQINMLKKLFICSFVILSILFPSCSTDLDVTGDYQETMVVYGLLDQSQAKQYIKINKAFLGKGNSLLFAKEKDSVQFKNLEVKLKRVSDSKEYILTQDHTIQKEEGTFFSGDQSDAIYSFNSTGSNALTANSDYTLTITNPVNGNKITSTTTLISDFPITNPVSTSNTSTFIFTPSNQNLRLTVGWNSSKNARLYQLLVRLNYKDYVTVNGVNDTIDQHLDWLFPAHTTSNANGGEPLSNSFSRAEYLEYIGTKLSDYGDLKARKAVNIDLIIVGGGQELNTFMEVNGPSTGLVQDKPIYTNIDRGFGVFSSRYYKPPFILTLTGTTPGKELDSLACGRFTRKLKFLNASGVLPGC